MSEPMSDADFGRFIRRLVAAVGPDNMDDLFWFVGKGGDIDIAVNCNDYFELATSDCESITPERLELLERSMADARAADPESGEFYGTSLFASRSRGWRPLEPRIDRMPEALRPLFKAVEPRQRPATPPADAPAAVAEGVEGG